MSAWLDANAEGLGLMLAIFVLLFAFLCIAVVVEQVVLRRSRQHRLSSIDFNRCERTGSQREFERRLRARGTR